MAADLSRFKFLMWAFTHFLLPNFLQKKSSQKKLPKLKDNGSVDKNAEAEGGEVEDEDSIAAPRPKRSKRLMKNLNEDKEPEQEPTTDGDNPAEAAENNISPDDNDTEEAKDRTPSA